MNKQSNQDAPAKPKRPWRKPRLRFVHFKKTKAGVAKSDDIYSYNEGPDPPDNRYDPNVS